MRVLFVMDPVETIRRQEDTSFALMLQAQQRGHRVDHCLAQDVFLYDGKPFACVRQATVDAGGDEAPVRLSRPEEVSLEELDAIFVRKDPPFSPEYLWLTLMLDRVEEKTLVVNAPRGLREANEKLYACHFAQWMPATLVSADKARIKRFVRTIGGKAVIKPVDGHGGDAVFALSSSDQNQNALIELLTQHGARPAVVQEFLPAVRQGDKRILLLDGEPLGAIWRIPLEEEFRSNIHVGGRVEAATLDANDEAIIRDLAPRLRQDGLWFVGLDVIGGRLTEINVTSPTGIQQISRLCGGEPAARVVQWAEERVMAHV